MASPGFRGWGAKLISRVPLSSFPRIPLLFVPLPLSLLSDISSSPFLFPIFPSQNPSRGLGEHCKLPPARGGAPAAKAFLPYFETRRRSSCSDFGSFCTDQNIHLTQDRSYWLLSRHTPVMIISHRISADLRIDPGEGWGQLPPFVPFPWRRHCRL